MLFHHSDRGGYSLYGVLSADRCLDRLLIFTPEQ
jgi:hypothetical protein